MKRLLPLLILAFAATFEAQQPDRWHGLIIDETNPEMAIAILGKPSEDKTDSFRVYKIERWITSATREKKFRRLEYKGIEGMGKVILAFDKSKLVFIELNPDNVSPNAIENAYGTELRPLFGGLDEALSPKDFYRNNGRTYAKSYPTYYYLAGVADKTFVLVGVGNSSFGSVFKKSMGVPDSDTGGYPGKVSHIQLISRTLENKDNVNILK